MAELELLREPMLCPVCADKLRQSFLKRLNPEDTSTITFNGYTQTYECQTCYSIFGTKQ